MLQQLLVSPSAIVRVRALGAVVSIGVRSQQHAELLSRYGGPAPSPASEGHDARKEGWLADAACVVFCEGPLVPRGTESIVPGGLRRSLGCVAVSFL